MSAGPSTSGFRFVLCKAKCTDKGDDTPVPIHGQELRSERRPHPQFVPSRLEGGAKVESGEHLPERLLRQEGVINVHLRQ
jgi:hypothetical protein